jgi:P-type Ca2+ transporter type 2C
VLVTPEKIAGREEPPSYALPADVVLRREVVDPSLGLGEAEAASRLTRYGPNALLAHARRTAFAILIDQLNSPVVWLLSAAAALAAAFGEWNQATAILLCSSSIR